MIRITIVPQENENLYSLMVKVELDLRKRNTGTLHRTGKKKKDEDRWFHTSKDGWIKFKRSLGEIVVVTIQSKNPDKEWDLLTAFVGFIYRHFSKQVRTITLDLKD
ncbi:MAG: hypothetical protein EPN88_07895 [Bacteroidetes bacterium]|nr:MAG: hypothetical protein EPN88_07895 [Bacteroidota bacterium]